MVATSKPLPYIALRKQPKAELLVPPLNMASCLYGALVRDTRGCSQSGEAQINHFSASPLCAISWCFEGSCSLLSEDENGNVLKIPISNIAFSGPQTKPMTSVNNGPVYAMTVAIFPNAFKQITGIDVSKFIDRTVPVSDVLSGEFLELETSILCAGNADAGFEKLINFLQPNWQEQRAANPKMLNAISDWTMSIVEHAPKEGVGRSLRQIERHIKNWTGHSQRDLTFFTRNEKFFELARQALQKGSINAADIAQQSGFSDQSHLGRSIKLQTGHSPKDLLWHIENDEAYWSYRLIAGIKKGVDHAN